MKRTLPLSMALACSVLVLQGCAASVETAGQSAGESTGGLALPKADTLLPRTQQVIGTPTELYTRIARGALTCWFGAAGPLKGTYIYHADAAPASQGGRSEIVIRIRDTTKVSSSEQKSLRAFRVLIAPGESKPIVDIENIKIPEPLAKRLSDDVNRWAADEEGCGPAPPAEQWAADPNAPGEDKKKKAATGKKPAAKKTSAGKPAAKKSVADKKKP